MRAALKGKIVSVASLKESDKRTMYSLMVRYYDHMQWDRFTKDLDQKKDVILLVEGKREEIKGFSTLMITETEINGQKARAIFSGDTVVDKAYWGQRVLGRKFLSYLFAQKIRYPLSPLYWLLISKGYKTYLLMANNFSEHYPRFEKPTPSNTQQLMDVFASNMFGDSYSAEHGCCKFPESLGQLREGVAELSDKEIYGNERIQFFLDKNPGWKGGEELVCLARMSWSMPLYYLTKSWWKLGAKANKPSVEKKTAFEETTAVTENSLGR